MPSDRLSLYMTRILQPIVQKIPSYLKGSKQLLQVIKDMPALDKGTMLVTADVKSLFTMIPLDQAVTTVMKAIETNRPLLPSDTPDDSILRQMLRFILEHNHFSFMDRHFKQVQGVAMGTRSGVCIANIFMDWIERELTQGRATTIPVWKRFVDDIWFVFKGDRAELDSFMQEANSLHPSIKFEFEISLKEVDFLDLHIYKDRSNKLQTTIFRKPTDKNLLLHFDSKHPLHQKRNLVYTQALRYRMLISTEAHLAKELRHFRRILEARGYPIKMIRQQVDKALQIPREVLLQNKPTTTKAKRMKGLRFKIPIHPKADSMKKRILGAWNEASKDNAVSSTWLDPPSFLPMRGPNVGDILVRTRQHSPPHA